jgi:DNA adenine methylase
VLEELHERLAGVVIERLPYATSSRATIGRPRFSTSTRLTGAARTTMATVRARDFERLAEQLAGIRGQFILSINDTPGAREVFGRFELEEVETTYGIGTKMAGAGKRVGELIIRGGGGLIIRLQLTRSPNVRVQVGVSVGVSAPASST